MPLWYNKKAKSTTRLRNASGFYSTAKIVYRFLQKLTYEYLSVQSKLDNGLDLCLLNSLTNDDVD
jgi:hypothetical protein